MELEGGDIRRVTDVRRALKGVDAVFHFVAAVCVGQSMYRIKEYASVNNLARARRLALEAPEAEGKAFNVGAGRRYTVRTVAERMAATLGKNRIRPEITGKYRVGDIRHCFADISLAREVLGYKPQVTLEYGLADLAEWLARQMARPKRIPDACA